MGVSPAVFFITGDDMGFFDEIGEKKGTRTSTRGKFNGGCSSCDLNCGNSDTGFVGKGRMGILILAGHPMRGEDNGRGCFASKVYDELFNLQGNTVPRIMENCWIGYTVPCFCDTKQEKVTNRTLCCQVRTERLIEELKPKVIISLGIWPTSLLVSSRASGRMNGLKPSEFFGKCIPDRKYNCWICPTYSPDMLKWKEYENDDAIRMYFREHIVNAFAHAEIPMPEIPNDWRIGHDLEESRLLLSEVLGKADDGMLDRGPDGEVDIAIDYETTGLKPHRDGHRITFASVSWREDGKYRAIGLPWYGDDPSFVSLWHGIVSHGGLKLVAHKCDYEITWTKFRAGHMNRGYEWLREDRWSWDTCIAAHVLDNMQKVNLKFHTYCELGVLGYDADADEYLKASDRDPTYGESCNAFNGLKDNAFLPVNRIAEYCAKDSLYTLWLRDRQQEQLEAERLMKPYRRLLRWSAALAEIQGEGFPIDLDKLDSVRKQLEEQQNDALNRVLSSKEAAEWKRVKGTELNVNSQPQMVEWLYDVLKLTPPNGKRDATKDTLSKLRMQFADDLLDYKKWAKTKDTFMADYSREAVWDAERGAYLVRPFFNLAAGASENGVGGPRTYRSSSDSPNFQNVPKRDKVMKKILRSLFVAPEGYRYMEVDYKALETYISCSYNHDPQLLAYLQDPNLDMHRRAASLVFRCDPSEVTKDMRQMGKKWNFSSFYGSGYKNSAEQIWKDSSKETKEFAAAHGMPDYGAFELQCRRAYNEYWGKDFKVYDEWRKGEWNKYQRKGELRSVFGFRYRGPMLPTNCSNVCIQGTGAHCLLEGMTMCLKDFRELGLKSRIIGEIHDSIVILCKDEEVEKVCSIVWKNNVDYLNRTCKWLALPLVEECDIGRVGGSWADMTEIGACTEDGVENREWRKQEM